MFEVGDHVIARTWTPEKNFHWIEGRVKGFIESRSEAPLRVFSKEGRGYVLVYRPSKVGGKVTYPGVRPYNPLVLELLK